jgi:amidase
MSHEPERARTAPQLPGSAPGAREFVFVERMEPDGPGLRAGIKDSIDIAGYPTRMGSACFADAPPAAEHAAVVRSLLDAGCRIVGKTNMHELAYGLTGINHWSGTPQNPRAPGRVPGGSSSGSAVAVAACLVDFALATDTGGSIRIPSACCGIIGLKPSYGRVSRAGVHPAASSLDCVGPMARDIPTIERVMSIIDASFRPQAAARRGVIGWVQVEAAPAVAAAARAALVRTDIVLQPVGLPSLTAAFAAALAIIGSEYWAAFGHLAASAGLGTDVRTRLLASRAIGAAEVSSAEGVRQTFRAEIDAALDHADALALPTLPDLPLTLAAAADPRAALASSALVRQFNLSGHPAITLPLDLQGVPAGLQLIGRRGGDEALCALAHMISERLMAAGPSEHG